MNSNKNLKICEVGYKTNEPRIVKFRFGRNENFFKKVISLKIEINLKVLVKLMGK